MYIRTGRSNRQRDLRGRSHESEAALLVHSDHRGDYRFPQTTNEPLVAKRNGLRDPIIWQFVHFAGVGFIATAWHYLLLIVLVQGYALNATLASSIGALGGACVSYLLNYRYTFRSTANHAESLVKFFIVAGSGLLLNLGCMLFGINLLKIHYLVSQVLATGVVLLWTFSANRWWTFRESIDKPN